MQDAYSFAKVDKNGNLILFLTNRELKEWKNSNVYLQILQEVLGDEKEIVTKRIQPTDDIFKAFYEDAQKDCGFEISDDYTKIIAGPGDDKSYVLVIPFACVTMQVIEGTHFEKINTEYIELDDKGNVINSIMFPNDNVSESIK